MMLPQSAIDQADDVVAARVRETLGEAIARRRATGWRYQCSFCKSDLPGSNSDSPEVSHGMCNPPCAAAKAKGWGAPLPTVHDPLGPLMKQI